LPCLALPSLALPCLALPCPALPCPALPCPALHFSSLPSLPFFPFRPLPCFPFLPSKGKEHIATVVGKPADGNPHYSLQLEGPTRTTKTTANKIKKLIFPEGWKGRVPSASIDSLIGTEISLRAECFVLECPYCIFCTEISLLLECFVLECPYWLHVLYWNVLTEYFVPKLS
jgi:hypothetical protein